MNNQNYDAPQTETFLSKEVQTQLKVVFEQLPYSIPVYLFTQAGQNEDVNSVLRQLMGAIQEVSSGKVRFQEYDLGHEMAKKWEVDRSPTILLAPERYKIRYLGVPLGEEGSAFLEALILIGLGQSNLVEPSQKVVAKINSPRNVKVFVSLTCPYCPQQALTAMKTAIENPEHIAVEIIDIQFNPDLAEQYSAFGVPQTYAEDVLIATGAQSEELFASSLEKLEQQTVFIPETDAPRIETDLVIVGGGPAGLAAGIYAVRSGLKTAVVERGSLGGQVATTPIVENYPGLTRVPGKTLVDIMVAHALEYVEIFPREDVLDIQPGDPMQVFTSRRQFSTRAVLLATGANYRRLGIPGEAQFSGRGVSYCSTCDGPLFKGKKVVVVGGGNSATTETLHLYHIGVDVTLIHRRDTLRAQEHLAKDIFANNIPVLWNTEVKEIRGKERVSEILLYNNRTEETKTLPIDGVFIAIGYVPEVGLARKLGVELTPDGFIKHDSHRTNVPGVYTAGDVEGGYKQIVTATGQGAEAAMILFEDLKHPYWEQPRKVGSA
jgi:thioredoxin reductase (NADPH)